MGLPIFPPADFDDVIERYLTKRVVNIAPLIYFDFRDGPQAYCALEYDVRSGNVTWQGLGKSGVLIQIEGLGDVGGLEASEVTITASGVEAAIMALLKDEDRADYVSRLCGIYMQFFDENWQVLCSPFAVWAGFMGDVSASRSATDDGWVRTVSIAVSNLFYGRGNAPASFVTDRDQKLRFDGDRMMEFVWSIQETAIAAPWH